jgi:hypothetical protein
MLPDDYDEDRTHKTHRVHGVSEKVSQADNLSLNDKKIDG